MNDESEIQRCDTDASEYENTCVTALRKSGARITKARRAVITCLATSSTPLTARELYQKIKEDEKTGVVDQVSVYRILDALLELHLVHQVFPSGGFLPCFHHSCETKFHILIRCTSCEQIEELDVPQETLAPIVWYLRNNIGFEVHTHVFQMDGTCKKCGK